MAQDAALDALSKQILVEMREHSIAAPSGTFIGGKYVLYVAHTDHRSQQEDFDILVREVIRIGQELILPTRAAGLQR